MPGGDEVTVPIPVPDTLTFSGYMASAKAASADRAPFIVIWHGPVPEQAPLQPTKTDPPAGVGVSVTTVPAT
jgi:hypothetical protein